jgi:hypothetical protein
MSTTNDEYIVLGFNDLDKKGKQDLIKKTMKNGLQKTYIKMQHISEFVATQIGFNSPKYQYVMDAMELRKFKEYIQIEMAKEQTA